MRLPQAFQEHFKNLVLVLNKIPPQILKKFALKCKLAARRIMFSKSEVKLSVGHAQVCGKHFLEERRELASRSIKQVLREHQQEQRQGAFEFSQLIGNVEQPEK